MRCDRTFCVLGIVFGFVFMMGLAACGGGGSGGDKDAYIAEDTSSDLGNTDASVPQSDVPQQDAFLNEDAYINKDASGDKQECLLGTNTNCSACDDACWGGKSCQGGQCQCPATETDCFGTCKPLGTNSDCSECGDVCGEGKNCKNGQCIAKPDPECLPSIPCVENIDCPSGNHCNKAVKPPACQKLYCGDFLSACSEDAMCLSQHCYDDLCGEDCSGMDCGPGLVYGESCGSCPSGWQCGSEKCWSVCESGKCVCKPQDHKGCCNNNICWIDSCGYDGTVLTACPLACLNGKCVDCAAINKADCSGTCKPLGTDSDCSKCGDKCDSVGGKSCQESACKCWGTKVDCSGTCKPLGTNSDCSECDDACDGVGGKSCQGGQCQCPATQVDCSGTCKPLGTDNDCSECGDKCMGGKNCQDGHCTCPNGQTDCSGTCKPLGTDSDCSKCGDKCADEGNCEAGYCVCPGAPSQVDCSGTCKWLWTNSDCSGCGDACSLGMKCIGKKCVEWDCEGGGCPPMVAVPGGPFMMGCNEAVDMDCFDDEKPYHQVNVPSFYIDKYEVTVAAYKACHETVGCTQPSNFVYLCNWEMPGKKDHPINCIDWDQAWDYCDWAGKRLCSEAEWEKAARGTDGQRYPWGNETATCQYAVMYEGELGCGTTSTMAVGSKPAGASPYGTMDMAGNVGEWVEDGYHSDYTGAPTDGSAWKNPSSFKRMVRGGSFVNGADGLRASERDVDDPSHRDFDLGVRCCVSP